MLEGGNKHRAEYFPPAIPPNHGEGINPEFGLKILFDRQRHYLPLQSKTSVFENGNQKQGGNKQRRAGVSGEKARTRPAPSVFESGEFCKETSI